MCLGSDENAKIGCKGRRAKGKKVGTNKSGKTKCARFEKRNVQKSGKTKRSKNFAHTTL